MPFNGVLRQETQSLWDAMRGTIAGHRFITCKLTGMGLSTCRNMITELARRSRASKVIQLDSDINAGPVQIERLLSHDYEKTPFVGGYYPMKTLNLTWVGNLMGEDIRPDGLGSALDFGGGLCCFTIKAIEKVIEHFPEIAYESDHHTELVGVDGPPIIIRRGDVVHDLWSEGVVLDTWGGKRTWRRKLTEDFYFCWRAKAAGFPLFIDTRCQGGHVGPTDYLKVWSMMQEAEDRGRKNLLLEQEMKRAAEPTS